MIDQERTQNPKITKKWDEINKNKKSWKILKKNDSGEIYWKNEWKNFKIVKKSKKSKYMKKSKKKLKKSIQNMKIWKLKNIGHNNIYFQKNR